MRDDKSQEQPMDAQQSLTLIAQMLRETERKAEKMGALPMLVFGYLSLLSSIGVYLLYPVFGTKIFLLWMAIPVLGFEVLSLAKRRRMAYVKTVGDRFVQALWIVISVVCVLMGLTPRLHPIMLAMTLIVIAAGTLVTAITARLRLLQVMACLALVGGFAMLHIRLPFLTQTLIFGLALWLLLCVPGHALRWKNRHDGR